MESSNLDGSAIYPRLHNRYIAYVYPKYWDYNSWNFPQRTFSFNTEKLLLCYLLLSIGLNFVVQSVLYSGA